MRTQVDEHMRTMEFAEIALGQIRALQQPASPRNYELWYTYATGYNPALNKTINDILTRSGTISEIEFDLIYQTYLSTQRVSERLDLVGSKVVDEIDQVMSMIEAAAGSASSYSESLADASQKLVVTKDNEAVRLIVESLVHAAREMELTNKALEASLIASKREITLLQQQLESVRNESMIDPLTTLANRKSFDESLRRAIEEAHQNHEPLSLMMCDVDNFKAFNDNYGHLTGDQVLRLVSMAVKQNVKGLDIAARYGGEEFAIVLPATLLRSALTVADHIRRAVMMKDLIKRSTGEHLGRVTISIGVAQLHENDKAQTLIERADRCLYAAKHNGRNRVICESDPEVMLPAAPQVA